MSRHILVIEDNKDLAHLLELHLRDLAYDVDLTFEGDKGLAELAPVHLLMVEGVLELLRSDHVLLQQQLTKSDGHSLSVGKS